jgi:hypothetical protein
MWRIGIPIARTPVNGGGRRAAYQYSQYVILSFQNNGRQTIDSFIDWSARAELFGKCCPLGMHVEVRAYTEIARRPANVRFLDRPSLALLDNQPTPLSDQRQGTFRGKLTNGGPPLLPTPYALRTRPVLRTTGMV